MKTKLLLCFVLVVMCVGMQAQDISGFLGFGGTIPTSDCSLSGSATIGGLDYRATLDVEAGANLATRLGVKWSVLDWLAIGASFDYSGVRLDRVHFDHYTALNRLGIANAFSLLAFVEFRLETSAGITPYVQLGGGVNFNYFDAKPDIAKNLFREKHTPAFLAAIGVEFFSYAAMGLFVEVRYLHNDSTWNVRHSTVKLDAELSNVAVLAGLTLHGRSDE